MKQVFIDTSHKYLTIACIDKDEILSFYHEYAFKNQSEIVMSILSDLVSKAKWEPQDIDRIVITKGPGSYTGVRIAMTIAKTLSAVSDVQIATVTSLECYVNTDKKTFVMLDARSDRVYGGYFIDKKYVEGPRVYTLDEVRAFVRDEDPNMVGDLTLIGREDIFSIDQDRIIEIITQAVSIDDVDHLKPMYLKEMSAY